MSRYVVIITVQLKGNVSKGKACTIRKILGFIGLFFFAIILITSVYGFYVILGEVENVRTV